MHHHVIFTIHFLSLKLFFFLRMTEVGRPWFGPQSTNMWTKWSCFCPKELTSASGTRLAKDSVYFVIDIEKCSIIVSLHCFLFRRKTSAFTGQRSLAAWRLPSCCWTLAVICKPSTSTETLLYTSLLGRIAWIVSRELLALLMEK